jgi:CHAT domain-containing protein
MKQSTLRHKAGRYTRQVLFPLVTGLVVALLLLGLAFEVDSRAARADEDEPVYWFRISSNGAATVQAVSRDHINAVRPHPGLLLWLDENGNDRWSEASRTLPDQRTPQLLANKMATRVAWSASRGESELHGPGVFSPTRPLDQLTGGEILRGVGEGELLTPVHQQVRLDGRPTLRRVARAKGPPFPAAEYSLWSDNRELGKISFPAGRVELKWQELTDLPAAIQAGLPPGRFALRGGPSGDSRIFQVAEPKVRRQLMADAETWAEVTGGGRDPVYLQLAADALLAARNEDDQPQPFLADLLDLLDEAELQDEKQPARLTRYLRRLRADVESHLRGDSLMGQAAGDAPPNESRPEPGHPRDESSVDDADATGIPVIDQARELLARGQWSDTDDLLRGAVADPDERTASLAALYLAVVSSHSGQANAAQTKQAFRKALQRIPASQDGDAFRARVNYATHLLNRIQDLLYSRNFQAASGEQGPFSAAAAECVEVERLLDEMTQSAMGELDSLPRFAVVNLQQARYSLLLADFLHLLNSALPSTEQFLNGEQSAKRTAQTRLEGFTRIKLDKIPWSEQAAAWELLARCVYRDGDATRAKMWAQRAHSVHLESGSLAGLETAERLWGIAELLEGRQQPNSAAQTATYSSAERHLQAARVLGEILQARFPADAVGTRRAGFFSRRVYVIEQLMELRIEQGRFADALAFCEEAKARTLDQALAGMTHELPTNSPLDQAGDRPQPDAVRLSVAGLLKDWPHDTAAVEYYLTAERPWVFGISARGEVRAYAVRDEQDRPLTSSQLLAKLSPFLQRLDGAALKLLEEARTTGKFDQAWQDELLAFYKILLPAELRESIGKSPRLLIVPHHLLHYFPFAALVVRRDDAPRGPLEMPQPRFLIDEPMELNSSPSLVVWKRLRESSTEPLEEARVLGISEFDAARPLAGVERDLRSFRGALGERVREMLTGRDASESSARTLLPKRGLLFLATHGKNVPDDPLASYLLCHADQEHDGRLTAAEILAGDKGASMVVMSACYSGLAERSPLPGDDLFGLQRAFLQRGAKTVVAGLWDVYDETGVLLMETFFNELAKGQGAPAALAVAQRQFLAQRRAEGAGDPWIHPYFWAVYKSSGSERTRFAPAPAVSKPGSP